MSGLIADGSSDTSRRKHRLVDGDEDSSRIKTDPDSDIKDYAETTMNELLGWYGLDKLDSRALNLKSLNHHFPTSSSSSSPQRHDDESEDDFGRRSRSPIIESESLISNPSSETIICAWCQKMGLKLFTLKTSSGKTKVFCSEPCFNQCRRAAFKKNRVCNWCRHVRHTVNYVDFKDGDEQLQFCSDKCLNQYKMQIFCKETQAYLQMNPHLQEEANRNGNNANSKLITPDLWLRDCQEPANGGTGPSLSNSDDDRASPVSTTLSHKEVNENDLEDLSVKHNHEKFIPVPLLQRENTLEMRKTSENIKDKRLIDTCVDMVSYLKEDKNILDRRKRHFENDREHFRRKQRMSNLRHRMNHHQEAPPAHMASAAHAPPITFPGQTRLYQHSTPPFLLSNPPSTFNPPAAHSKTVSPHSTSTLLTPPGLPPPPPLLNSELFHNQYNHQIFPSSLSSASHQQQLEAFLRMQSLMGKRPEAFPPTNVFPESTRASPSQYTPGAPAQPNTVMLPYPVFLPLPVPIPIPIPLSHFLKKYQKDTLSRNISENPTTNGEEESAKNVNVDEEDKTNCSSTKLKNSKSEPKELTKKDRSAPSPDTSSYAIRNNDSQTNRLILTRNKKR